MIALALANFTKYEYYGTFSLPYGNNTQPIYVAFDEENFRERISYFNDSDYTIWNGRDEYYTVLTYFNGAEMKSHQKCLTEPLYLEPDPSELLFMLPNVEDPENDFVQMEDVVLFGETYHRYERHIIDTPGGDIPMAEEDPDFNFTYVRDDYQEYYCKVQGDLCIPFKWEFFGRDTIFSSHYDYYVLEISQFNNNPVFNSSVFAKPNLTCTPLSNSASTETSMLKNLIKGNKLQKEEIAQNSSFTTAANRVSDMPRKDALKIKTGYRKSAVRDFAHNLTAQHWLPTEYTDNYYVDEKGRKIAFPQRIDWRVKSSVTGVRDQCACGSCWAFGTAAAIESRVNILLKDSARPLFEMSEEAIVDCAWTNDLLGCDGGETPETINVLIDRFGGKLPSLTDYPYYGQDMACETDLFKYDEVLLKGFYSVPDNINLLKYSLLEGPLEVSIAVPDAMFAYNGGIYDDPACAATTEDDLIHSVTLVGYDTSVSGEEYWIIKNSWSNMWGADGYIYIKFGYCGVTLQPVAAVLEVKNE